MKQDPQTKVLTSARNMVEGFFLSPHYIAKKLAFIKDEPEASQKSARKP
jgi:hypothetical protein